MFSKDLACFPCQHGKMIAGFNSQINLVLTKQPRELLHFDIIGPSQVRSMGGKWFVLCA
jgi:hypothetical protein